MGLLDRILGNQAGVERAGTDRPTSAVSAREDDRLAEGLRLHQAGELPGAERAYREVIAGNPESADAHYFLGSLLGASGRLDDALEHLQIAIRLSPSAAAPRMDLGNVLHAQGRIEEAESAYRDAIGIDAGEAGAHRNLGMLLHQLGRFDEALESLARAAERAPEDAGTQFMLADLLSSRGRYREACRSYRAGLVHAPGVAMAHNNLGASLRHLSRDEEARACFEEALRIDDGLAGAHENLGELLEVRASLDDAIGHYRAAAAKSADALRCRRGLGRLLLDRGESDAALRFCREAAALGPDDADVRFELGNALMACGRTDEAIEALRRSVRMRGDDPRYHVNLGFALYEARRYEEAAQSFRTAVKLDDGLIEAHNNLGSVLQQQGELDGAMQALEEALERAPDQPYVRSNLLTCMNYQPRVDPETVFVAHRAWAKLVEGALPPSAPAVLRNPEPERRLRIGYVSADFRIHSVSFFFAPLLENHDREHFEITCYANVTKPDATTERFKALSDHWRDIATLSNEEVAAHIRRDGIDILIDLSGHTVANRLPVFAERPAPVQVTYLGYPNTTGLEAMDYRLTDARSDPPGTCEHLYCEELVRIDETFLCFQPLAETPPIRARDDQQGITFASFNELLKLTPEIIAAWCDMLERISGSILVIKGTALEDPGTRARIEQRFLEHGLSLDRLRLLGRTESLQAHLDLYNDVDVALDTFPYNGTTTTCEALWMGVPVVTLAGSVHASRVGSSILAGLGLSDLVAADPQDYVDKSIALARDPARRAELRRTLRDRMRASPLMDAVAHTRRIESAYRDMWRRACRDGQENPTDHPNGSVLRSVRIAGGTMVCVPERLDALTTYVLLEQEDWFEDEIRFVRRVLEPGMRCVDVGASYGLYTLACAAAVGPEGRVWSFEPTPDVASALASSIDANGFENIVLLRTALADEPGTASLVVHRDSEHNHIVGGADAGLRVEIVDVGRLDEVARGEGIEAVDLVKLDAEGAETAILEGGAAFFERESPLVLFEFNNQQGSNWALIEALQSRGYGIFRLVPGLCLLAPFEPDSIDAFQLNLFACQGERLTKLQSEGLAAVSNGERTPPAVDDMDGWLEALGRRAYAGERLSAWRSWVDDASGSTPRMLLRALRLYVRSHDAELPAADRLHALEAAFEASTAADAGVCTAQLYTRARIAVELGYRQRAIEALDAIHAQLDSGEHDLGDMPFLAVSERFDTIRPGARFADWCLVSVLEQRVRLAAFSSYFQSETTLQVLERLAGLPFPCADMERRRQLVRMRAGLQKAPQAVPLLSEEGPDNLNADVWRADDESV